MRLSTASLLLVLLAGSVAFAAPPSFQEIEESLTCQCGCGLTVHSCNHLQCPSALPLREEIRERMSLGEDKETILAHFAAKYGEKILSSPTTKGFNLAAWIMPFVAVGFGGVIIAFTARRWRRRVGGPADAQPPQVRAAPAEHVQILERELKEYNK